MTTTIRTDHPNELIAIDHLLEPGGGPRVALGLINEDGSDTFPGRTLTPDQAEELAAGLALSAAAARARAGLGAEPREGELVRDETLTAIRAAVPLIDADAHAPEAASELDELPIAGYDELTAAMISKQLAGLSAVQLSAVLAYEQGHRNRKTVCERIAALQASAVATEKPTD